MTMQGCRMTEQLVEHDGPSFGRIPSQSDYVVKARLNYPICSSIHAAAQHIRLGNITRMMWSSTSYDRKPYAFLVVSFALAFSPSTIPAEICPRARNQFKINGR
jgi:hypothetical protein